MKLSTFISKRSGYQKSGDGVNLHKSFFWTKKFLLEVSIFLITMKFLFQRYNIINIIANGLKPVNDKMNMINGFFMQISRFLHLLQRIPVKC